MSYSGTYLFQNIEVIDLIHDAYRCVGKIPSVLVTDDYVSAKFSLNLKLASWATKSVNLFAVSRFNFINLVPGKVQYELSRNIVDILEVCTRTSTRLLSGTAFASEGVAENAFDGNPLTACIQAAADGYIGYDFGEGITNEVQMFGLQSNVDRTYTINVQQSSDDITWETFLSIPETAFVAGETQWFNIESSKNNRYFRMLETGGSVLNIRECYFQGDVNDLMVTPESRSNYMSYPAKYNEGRPSVFIFNKGLSKTINFWPVPIPFYSLAMYNCTLQIQDIGSLTNTAAIPPTFYNALRDSLALELALKTKVELVPILAPIAEKSFIEASIEDSEKNIPITFDFDMSRYKR